METKESNPFCLIGGGTHPDLLRKISKILEIKPVPVLIKRFANGEIYCRPEESLRGKTVFIIQTANTGRINEDLLELFILLNAVRLASARAIHLLMPFFPYTRQERKEVPRAPISAAMIAEILGKVGKIDSLTTFDLHSPAIEGYFVSTGIPVAHLTARSLLAEALRKKNLEEFIVTAPDFGRLKFASFLAEDLFGRKAPEHLIAISKRKLEKKTHFEQYGECRGKKVILCDDMIDGGSSMIGAGELLQKKGCRGITAVAIHGIFSGEAPKRLQNAEFINEVIVTDTINIPKGSRFPKLKIVSVASILAEVIKRIHQDISLKDYQAVT